MIELQNLNRIVLSLCVLAIVPGTAMAEWQIDGSIDIPVEGVPYNEAIEISVDNNTALVTIDLTEQFSVRPGVAALERDSAGNWQSSGLLTPPASNGPNQFFGCSISIDADTALIGSCYRQFEQFPTDFSSNVAVYRKDNAGQWTQSATLPVEENYPQDQELPSFGTTVALEGDTAAVGLPGDLDSASGVVLIFKRLGEGDWNHEATIRSNTPTSGDRFGKSVTISGNDLFVAGTLDGQTSIDVGQVSQFTRNEASQWEFVEVHPTWSNTRGSKLVSTDNTLLVPSTRVTTAADGSVSSVGITHVVERGDNGQWVETQTLEVSDTLRDTQNLTPRVTTNDEHIAAPLFYFGRYADGDGTFGSLQDQQIRIFDRSANGEFIVSRTFETNIPGGDVEFPLDIGFAGTDILVGGTITDLLVIKDDSNDNGVCVDTDGDGWGWNGTNSCQTQDIMPVAGDCIDSDGDGYGWNGVASCIVETTLCIDSDGDGWGWDGSASCLVSVPTDTIPESVYDSLPCIDNDGDGWGWKQPPGRPDAGRSCVVL